MKHRIAISESTTVEVDEDITIADIRHACPSFFSEWPKKSRESYYIYHGFLIVRTTAHFTDGPERRTVVYLYTKNLEGRPDVFCVSAGDDIGSVREAKKLVDYIIKRHKYEYGQTRRAE